MWIVTLNRDKKGKLVNTSQMWIPYYDTIENDYKTAKALYISDDKQVFMPRQVVKDEVDSKYSKLRNGQSLSDALKKIGVTDECDQLEAELKFGGLLEEFIARGYDIGIKENDWLKTKPLVLKKTRK